jgi:hypothetical protein
MALFARTCSDLPLLSKRQRHPTKFWRSFSVMYGSLIALCEIRRDVYNRNLKREGYDKLAAKLKETEPTTDTDMKLMNVN